ncbi:hypothetical protein J4E83_001660 [Alternaria metachromatica]|uniref:uncharacterized protein n=1 Tax=Alternaria metachromatica TaxID=283354 RepID=UPI0020C35EF9|nr:uncharacterized protein J4E83_001660 [Alternaria metachromatica]KAI4634342.1 hypothetical protein J4E83_001660 [Alternaria metachromatica]
MNFDPSKFVTVIVGKEPDQQRFSVHEGIMCARSEFFQRAMNGNWTESKERIIRLPEDDPEIFNIYINFLYTGNVVTNAIEEPKTATHIVGEMHVLGRLYVIGEKLQDKATKNSAIKSLLEVAYEKDANGKIYSPSIDTITYVYRGTCAGSLGRRLLVDLWVKISPEYMAKNAETLPKEFLIDLAVALLADRPDKKPKLATVANVSNYMEKMD